MPCQWDMNHSLCIVEDFIFLTFMFDVVYFWLNQLQMVCELPAGTNWNFDVHWYPKIPGVISASSFDGKIGFYNMEVCSVLAHCGGLHS